MNRLQRIKEAIDSTEAVLVDLVAAIVPWFAPLIPAYMAYHNMVDVLQFNKWISFAGAMVIELLGLATVHTVFWLWDYNDTARKSDVKTHGKAPVLVAIGMSGFYLLIVVLVNVLLDLDAPWEQIGAKLLLSLISIPAAVTVAIRSQHKRRLNDVASGKLQVASSKLQEKIDRLQGEVRKLQGESGKLQAERDTAQATLQTVQAQLDKLQAQPLIPQELGPYGRDMLRLLAGEITAVQVAEIHNVHESTVSRDKSKLNGGV